MKEIPAQIRELRKLIDGVDDEIIQLVLKRIAISSRLMELKVGSEVVDPGREQAIVRRYFAGLGESSTLAKVERLVAGVIGAAKSYPRN